MKNIFLKPILLLTLCLAVFSSCVKEDDFAIPTLKPVLFAQDFEEIAVGSGSNEVAINLDGWVNANLGSGAPRVWSGKSFSNNKFAEFSSFYAPSGTSDDVWLITSSIDLSVATNKIFSFTSVNRFYNGSVLKVYISEDYDGTVAGITNANWIELNPILPTSSAQDDDRIASGPIDISSFNGTNVRIAFRYQGSKSSNPTTTFQLDDIKIYEN